MFHEGERTVQDRAGSGAMAAKIGTGIHDAIPERFLPFLAERRFVFLSTHDARRHLWVSPLFGRAGFLNVRDERSLRIEAALLPGDPLEHAFDGDAAVGMLAIDFAARRRLRLNGSARRGEAGITVALREVFPNCPKYIVERDVAGGPAVGDDVIRTRRLTRSATRRITAADTFFVGTAHARAGADVSHRGGTPGFVRVLDETRLAWPDYSGNFMFQTLGNLETDPAAGLLFVDFASGHVVQVTGRATVDWSEERRLEYPGAERVLDFAVDEVVERAPHNPLPNGERRGVGATSSRR